MNNFEMEGFVAQKKACGTLREKILWQKEEGDAITEYKGMQEEHFLSSWLKEDGKEKQEIMREIGKKTKNNRQKQ